jgi:hypothetical protein
MSAKVDSQHRVLGVFFQKLVASLRIIVFYIYFFSKFRSSTLSISASNLLETQPVYLRKNRILSFLKASLLMRNFVISKLPPH